MVDFSTFEESFKEWIAAETGRPVGLVEIPGINPNLPYAIMQPINSPMGEGDNLNPESQRDYVFQVMSVGKTPRQCRWMSGRVNKVLVGRDGNGVRLSPINLQNIKDDPNGPANTAPGGSVVPGSLHTDTLGAIVKTGDQFYQVVDTYRMKVQ